MDAISMNMNYVAQKKKFNFNEGAKVVALERLLYIESRLHKLEFYIMEDKLKKYSIYGKLDELEKELQGRGGQLEKRTSVSNGSFMAQIVASKNNIPALLGNPHFEMTSFLMERIGSHEYKSPRANGNQQFVINQTLIDEFAELQQHQWDNCQVTNQENIWGIFGENDHLAHFEPLFLMHYKYSYHFPGGHTPTAEEVQKYYAPLAERLLEL